MSETDGQNERDQLDMDTARRDFERDVYKRCDEEDRDPVAATKAWRDKHEKDYAELVTFVKALSAAPVYQGMYLLAYWKKDAQTLLKLLNGER